jgi:hypothetical protein
MITLRPYQTEAAQRLRSILLRHRIAYLRGEVRTGKTLTAFETARLLEVNKVLVVTKKKAIASIAKDAEAIGVSATVTNYEQLPKLKGSTWDLIIVDEAHGVGAYPKPSKRFKDLRQLHYGMVLLMSGTPSPESYSQLYHQFALGPAPWSQYRNFYRWADTYVCVKDKRVGTGTVVKDYSDAIEAMVLRDIEPLTVTITQEQAGFQTQIVEQVHTVPMKERTYRLARRIMRDGVVGKPGRRVVLADTAVKQMSKLHQIYSGTVITEHHGPVTFDRSKAEYCVKTFARKTAILYKFKAEGDMLKAAFDGRWTDSPEVFNATLDAVFIGQVQSSREGVNLSTADDLVFFSIDHASLSYLQGRDRASYLGRTTPPVVHWLFAERSIEPRIYKMVKEKQDYTVSHYRHDRAGLPGQADQDL